MQRKEVTDAFAKIGQAKINCKKRPEEQKKQTRGALPAGRYSAAARPTQGKAEAVLQSTAPGKATRCLYCGMEMRLAWLADRYTVVDSTEAGKSRHIGPMLYCPACGNLQVRLKK